MARRKHLDSNSTSDRDNAIDLMVEYWERTGTLFTGGDPLPMIGSASEILRKIEAIIDGRWCHQATYNYQAAEIEKALRIADLQEKIDHPREG